MKADGRVKGTNVTSRGIWREHLFKQTQEREETSVGGEGDKRGQLKGW